MTGDEPENSRRGVGDGDVGDVWKGSVTELIDEARQHTRGVDVM